MPKLPEFDSVLDVRYGISPELDAWLLHFMTENNMEYATDPEKNASPEQIRFMVHLNDEQVFAPCSDQMLKHLLSDSLSAELLEEYKRKWRTLVELVRDNVPDRYLRRRILGLCRHKFGLALASPIIIPSRLMKRLNTMFLTLSGVRDPYRQRRARANERAWRAAKSEAVDSFLNAAPVDVPFSERLEDLRFELDIIELERLLVLSTCRDIWEKNPYDSAVSALKSEVGPTSEVRAFLKDYLGSDVSRCLKILFLPDSSGGIIFDLFLIRSLLRQGHKVTLVLKEGFHFDAPAFWDWDYDSVLGGQLRDAHFVPEARLSKNELLAIQRENPFIIISDGTRENLNLHRTSVTFARAWKEADLVLAKGEQHYRRLIQSSHEFTRDIVCYFRNAEGRFRFYPKKKPESVVKFSEGALDALAGTIISSMRKAKREGNSVMFYSAVIGSIPGQTRTALKILETFIGYLRERLDKTFIVNPGEHFIEGMDADDLMYMWEKVQRSGLIDVWRFQTVEDIEKSFELMGEKVPPFWAGKDATFSTGCTKEMKIALDVQALNPEMQIIGPSPEKFFRRQEYGVGKFCDASIDCR